MALTREDLQAISELMDEKLKTELEPLKADMRGMKNDMQNMKNDMQSMKDRLEILEIKQDLTHKKLDSLTLDIKVSERAIKKDIKLLQDAQETLIIVLENQGILPNVK